ncbi:kinase-like domain-containing protein [Catenaria anguillulae PL171]|uniref:Phosphatidylinositol 3-kinase VPS34 n=1 Tax=Catenaria anguillulae PL171 TaxID=765915 RepID=A0A1Y2HFW5_9FUNG|nr:kinase-like domain-containing protein [Catenaria anguillulae PL171]
MSIWDSIEPGKHVPVGTAEIKLFDDKGLLKRGMFRLELRPVDESSGVEDAMNGSQGSVGGMVGVGFDDAAKLEELERLYKRFEHGDVQQIDWLDKLAIDKIRAAQLQQTISTRRLHLTIHLPAFDFPTIYNQLPIQPSSKDTTAASTFGSSTLFDDPEIGQENLVEAKHRQLARSHRTGFVDRNLKPSSRTRDELMAIVAYPPTRVLTVAEKDVVWNYRYYLSKDKHALTKFLKSVTWTDATECKQAIELMHAWARPDLDDALELLGPDFEHRAVRGFAVQQLARADDDELSMYLLQLVQALKFEVRTSRMDTGANGGPATVDIIVTSPAITTASSSSTAGGSSIPQHSLDSLTDFLVVRAASSLKLGTQFYWYLICEANDNVHGPMYKALLQRFTDQIHSLPDGFQRHETLQRQETLVSKLTDIAKEIRLSKESRDRKVIRLRDMLSDPRNGLTSFPPLPLPLDPTVRVTGIVPGRARIFKSALMPLLLVFACEDGSEYGVIFKLGDDLRQDQLVIQIIHLMDRLLQKENLNLQLTPYKVLATGPDQGFVQFIPSSPLAAILQDHGGYIQNFLRKHNADDSSSSSYGISAAAMDTYVRSCAGYCVITYLLGVGDRHLDNLLLTARGNLFHIDFGYILGRDPKPFPPPMKLCKEMVEAMGGAGSAHYSRFQSYAFVAFSTLRKSANLILNLLNLMVDANIPDIALEPDKTVVKVQDKFALELEDEEAAELFKAVVHESVNAMFPQVMETIHKWAQYWRR